MWFSYIKVTSFLFFSYHVYIYVFYCVFVFCFSASLSFCQSVSLYLTVLLAVFSCKMQLYKPLRKERKEKGSLSEAIRIFALSSKTLQAIHT